MHQFTGSTSQVSAVWGSTIMNIIYECTSIHQIIQKLHVEFKTYAFKQAKLRILSDGSVIFMTK